MLIGSLRCLSGLISDNASIFSEKQRRFLRSDEWAPNKLVEDEDGKEEEEEKKSERRERKRKSPSPKREKLKERAETKEESRSEVKTKERSEKVMETKTQTVKRNESKAGEAEKDVAGGWTFTIRERPMPDPSTSKKRKKAEDSEACRVSLSFNPTQARFEAMSEKTEASLKKQEEDVDSSLALLERLQTHAPVAEKPSPKLQSFAIRSLLHEVEAALAQKG